MDARLSSDRGIHALNISIVFTTIATVAVLARVYTRIWIIRRTGLDDLAILNALIFTWAFFAIFVYEVRYGMGQHQADIPAEILTKQLQALWASVPVYQMTLFSTKVSILLQYRRVFSIKQMRLACSIILSVIGVYGTWAFISAWLNCLPVAKFWNESLDGYCLNKEGLWFSNSALHILSDLIILLLPMPVLKSLQLPKKQKIALMAVFALGGFVVVTTIIRLHSLLIIARSSDPSYDNVGAATWSAVECNVAIICASLPCLKPLISQLFPRVFNSSAAIYNHSHTRHNRGTFPRSRTMNLSTVDANIIGRNDDDHDGRAMDMYDMDHRTSAEGVESSSSQENLNQDSKIGGIRVTTMLSQESVTRAESPSMRKVVMDLR